MNITDFKAGSYARQYKYKSFTPSSINQEWTWTDAKINTLLAEANMRLGELNAFSLYVPDIDIFIRMHVVKEATTSSRIEGTKTDVEEALRKEKDVSPEKIDDWVEVHNYVTAMNNAIKRLEKLPLSTRLLAETHGWLMQGVRGASKMPGEYRSSQNWIGGTTLNDALFIPPHHSEISTLMGDLEKFLHNESIDVPHLIKIAVAHYQFETIHPFLDGNGRVGRLLITLYLVSNGLLEKPTLYLSEYIEKHRNLYYDNLNRVRTEQDLTQWIKFFLVTVIETSKKGIATFQKILKLKEEIERKKIIPMGRRASKAYLLMTLLYKMPRVSARDVIVALDITPATANTLLHDFVQLGILKEVTGQKRNREFVFEEYLKLFQE